MKKHRGKIIYGFLTIVVILGFFLPLPYYIEGPGTTEDLKNFVTVDGKKDQATGSFSLTSVSVSQARPFTLLLSKFNDFEAVLTKKELMGDQTDSEYESIQRFYMETSQNMAKLNALELAGKAYDFKYLGVYVMATSKNSTFKDILQVGDTVSKIDGRAFKNTEDLMAYAQSKTIGDKVTITYQQNGETKEADGKVIKLENGKAGIGITLIDHTEITSDPTITIDAGSIGGPSAGLMFTLETYQTLTGKDLRNGKKIAGTGTIDSEGVVGRIGGIDKKIATAVNNKVDIFFAPDDEITAEMKAADPDIKTNYQEALAAKKKLGATIKIVPVKKLSDAVDYLEKMN
ncbi:MULTISPECIES: SepM family pheromone-processing serine protease [unclassified Enterococcus]|uniref:SepM family pheromone-processing serine protease n=1 Tax=unclassified Enterococcus TaxID=2608891 RepID=UPI00201B3F59|nr:MULTISPECIES: SepM family pheromone-processing serine protease [unclassified Enterococcus]